MRYFDDKPANQYPQEYNRPSSCMFLAYAKDVQLMNVVSKEIVQTTDFFSDMLSLDLCSLSKFEHCPQLSGSIRSSGGGFFDLFADNPVLLGGLALLAASPLLFRFISGTSPAPQSQESPIEAALSIYRNVNKYLRVLSTLRCPHDIVAILMMLECKGYAVLRSECSVSLMGPAGGPGGGRIEEF